MVRARGHEQRPSLAADAGVHHCHMDRAGGKVAGRGRQGIGTGAGGVGGGGGGGGGDLGVGGGGGGDTLHAADEDGGGAGGRQPGGDGGGGRFRAVRRTGR